MGSFQLSVIIPNYNNEKYIKQCIDSVLSQTYPINEIIIYDDCSTDASRDILKEYESRYKTVAVLFGEKNVGVSAARDRAIKAAGSDYICMLDSDDFFFDPYKIENEMNTIKKYYRKTGRRCIAFSQTIDVDQYGKPLFDLKHERLAGNEVFRIATRAYNRFMPRDYCFPKEYYDICGGYEVGLPLYEDWDLNLKLLKWTKFLYSGSYGTAYRHKQNGLSSVAYKKHFATKKEIFKKHPMNLGEILVFYLLLYGAYIKNYMKNTV